MAAPLPRTTQPPDPQGHRDTPLYMLSIPAVPAVNPSPPRSWKRKKINSRPPFPFPSHKFPHAKHCAHAHFLEPPPPLSNYPALMALRVPPASALNFLAGMEKAQGSSALGNFSFEGWTHNAFVTIAFEECRGNDDRFGLVLAGIRDYIF